MSSFSRRNLLAAGAASAAALGLSPLARAGVGAARKKNPKNVILLVSDGMSAGVVSMLDQYLRITESRESHWRELMNLPETTMAVQDTRSLSSLVTDSAAASSAWGSGQHVWNGMINTYPDGTVLRPLYDILREKKVRRGLVTSSTITHATPAGFAISIDNRDREWEIAEKYLGADLDVLMGGGDSFFSATARADKRDLYAAYAAAGYAVAKTRDQLNATPSGKKLLGIFSKSHIPYYLDRKNSPELAKAIPSLAEMTLEAIKRLKGSREGFYLQVEAARVDHAAHANDLGGLLWDQYEFDKAVQAAFEFAAKDGETLIIVTSDHANSNPGVNGSGQEYGDSTAGLMRLTGMKSSYEAILSSSQTGVPGYDALPRPGVKPEVDSVVAVVKETQGIELKKNEAQMVVDAMKKASPLNAIEQYSIPSSSLAIVLGNHTHVGWSGRQHTNDFTIFSAFGPGSDRFHGVVKNIDIFTHLIGFKGVKFKNPTMSFEDAQRAMEKKKETLLAEAVASHWY